MRDRGSDILLEGCVRITLGAPKQTERLIKALRQAVKEINPILIFDIDGVLVDISSLIGLLSRKQANTLLKRKLVLMRFNLSKIKAD